MRRSSTRILTGMLILIFMIQCGDSDSVIYEPDPKPDPELETPELFTPEDESEQSQPFTFIWQEVERAESYQIQLSVTESFDSLLVSKVADSTQLQIETLPENTMVYWRVRAQRSDRQGNWSEIFSFRTEKSSPDSIPPEETVLRIMPLGNSITEAFGYRIPLWNKLTDAGFEVNYVGSRSEPHPNLPDDDHEGHGGWYIGHIANNINDWLATYQPEYVLLMIGTNDIAWWTARTGEEIAQAHNDLVGQILDNSPEDTWVLVASIPPQSSAIVEPNNIDRAQLTQDFNAAMEQYMKQRMDNGDRVYFVDVYSSLSTSLLSDGIHPNQEGYEIIADIWYEALMKVLSQSQP